MPKEHHQKSLPPPNSAHPVVSVTSCVFQNTYKFHQSDHQTFCKLQSITLISHSCSWCHWPSTQLKKKDIDIDIKWYSHKCSIILKGTWTLFHFNPIFVPNDVGTRNPGSITSHDQGAATVHILISQVMTEPWPPSLCTKQKNTQCVRDDVASLLFIIHWMLQDCFYLWHLTKHAHTWMFQKKQVTEMVLKSE